VGNSPLKNFALTSIQPAFKVVASKRAVMCVINREMSITTISSYNPIDVRSMDQIHPVSELCTAHVEFKVYIEINLV